MFFQFCEKHDVTNGFPVTLQIISLESRLTKYIRIPRRFRSEAKSAKTYPGSMENSDLNTIVRKLEFKLKLIEWWKDARRNKRTNGNSNSGNLWNQTPNSKDSNWKYYTIEKTEDDKMEQPERNHLNYMHKTSENRK